MTSSVANAQISQRETTKPTEKAMSEQERSEIITTIVPVNSRINHNLVPPRPVTTGYYWRVQAAKMRRTHDIIDLDYFTGLK